MNQKSDDPNVSQPGAATPDAGDAGHDKPTSSAEFTEAQLEQLGNYFDTRIERQAQSLKDRRIPAQQRKLDEFEQRLAQYAAKTGQPLDKNAIREMQIDELLAQRGHASPPVAPGRAERDKEPVDLAAIIKAADLDANDPQVLQLAVQHAGNADKLKISLSDYKVKKTTGTAPGAASVVQPAGKSAPSNEIVLQQEYRQKLSKIKRGDTRAIFDLKREYKEKGLRV